MDNSIKEKIINSVFGENTVKKQIKDGEDTNCRYYQYSKTKVYVVIDDDVCAINVWGNPFGSEVPINFVKSIYNFFKADVNVQFAAKIKDSEEDAKGKEYNPLSENKSIFVDNEIDWNKIRLMTFFSLYIAETENRKIREYVEQFKKIVDENINKVNENLSKEKITDNDVLQKIKALMDEKIKRKETSLAFLSLKLNYKCLQYAYDADYNSEIWSSTKCHYEFNETKRPKKISICFHCEGNFDKKNKSRRKLAKLLEKDNALQTMLIKWQNLANSGICFDCVSTKGNADVVAEEAVRKMLEFEKQYGPKILELIQKSKGELPSENNNGGEKKMSVSETNKEKIALNTILYGPPGTGKTFNTMAYAVAICEDKDVEAIKKSMQEEGYKSIKQRYDALKDEGRIEFVTFHQSYGYEDFIEGIKPDLDDSTGTLKYKLETGRFKAFCDKISGNFDDAWGVLCDKLDDEDKEYLEIPYISDKNKTFAIEWNVSHNGLKAKDAHRFFNKKQLQNIYRKKPGVKKGGHDNYRKAIVEYMKKECGLKEFNGDESNDLSSNARVFIIDEINRGNISKIFGELITLIEPSKRLGEKENLKVTLPCSGDEFGVPNNVYILGTMNTADRSIAMMDTALRRRFNFVEMIPDTSESSPLNGKIIEGIDICKMLMTINKRIEYLYDREHTIGHAFFIGINDFAGLSSVFRNKVIPLLQEYFYDDYEKIRLVLGDDGKSEDHQFVTKKKPEPNLFRGQVFEDGSDDEKYIYEVNEKAFNLQESYKGII